MISGTDIKLALSTLSDLVKRGMTIEAQEKIMELREMLLDLREQNVDLRQENAELKGKIEEKDALFFENGVYWLKKEDGTKDGPFCLPCHDNNGKLVRLTDNGECFRCPVHGCSFYHRYKGEEHPVTSGGRRGWGDSVAGY